MSDSSRRVSSLRFTVRGLLVLITTFACLFALLRWIHFVILMPAAVIPVSVILEYVLGGQPTSQPRRSVGWYVLSHVLLILCGAAPVAAAWISIAPGWPRAWAPFPMLVIMPLFMELSQTLLGLAVLGSFVALNLYVARAAQPQPIPLRFPIVLGISTALSSVWFWLLWTSGVEHYGASHVWSVLSINIVLVTLLWSLGFIFRTRATRAQLLSLAILMHCWLFWFAFPWLFELP